MSLANDEKYQRYLQSREWAVLRNMVKQRCGGICERCRYHPMDAVHHLTYIRLYSELPEDLQAICNGCHNFTHGKSDQDPIHSAPTRLYDGTEVRSVYLAGTCQPNELYGEDGEDGEKNWRAEFTDAYFLGHKQYDIPEIVRGAIALPSGSRLDYLGPFIQYEHNCYQFGGHGACMDPREVHAAARRSIKRADLVFAWVDRLDCFGTFAEIGFAHGVGKRVIIRGPEEHPDLWFVYAMGEAEFSQSGPRDAFNQLFVPNPELAALNVFREMPQPEAQSPTDAVRALLAAGKAETDADLQAKYRKPRVKA